MLTDLLFLVASTGNSQIQWILKPEMKNLLNLLVKIFTKQYLGNKSCDVMDSLFFFFSKISVTWHNYHRHFLPSNSLQECFASTTLHVCLFLIEMF